MTKLIKKKILNILRNYLKIQLTGNLGKVVEDENKIICYVSKRKCKYKNFSYTVPCFGINERNKKVAKMYKLDKPICYVIDGLEFKKEVYILGYDNCEIIIKNCKFNFNLGIQVNGKCTLKNTFIIPHHILSVNAKELVIEDIDIINQLKYAGVDLHIILAGDKKLDIINSSIGREKEKTKVSIISADQLNLVNSKIVGDIVKCDAKRILANNNSSLVASDKVILKTNDFQQINITSPTIICNDNIFNNKKQSITLEKLVDPLKIKRVELIELLKKIKYECEKNNTKKINRYRNKLNNKPISKVLKK